MGEKTKVTATMMFHFFIMAVACVLCVVMIFGSKFPKGNFGMTLLMITDYLNVIALVLGFLYLFNGYKKSAAGLYKAFLIVFGISRLVMITSGLIARLSVAGAIVAIVGFICQLILTFGKDLGKKKSTAYGAVLAFCLFLLLVFSLVENQNPFSNPVSSVIVINSFSNLMLGITCGLMVAGKYYNKELRGKN